MRRIKIKVLDIQQIGHVDLRRVLNEQEYNITRLDLLPTLPTWPELKKASWGFDDLRILLNDLEVIAYTNVGTFRFTFNRGYITDLASVPKFVRSLIDNDDKRLVLASMIHDALFLNHWLDFKMTNSLFRAIIIYNNKNKKFLANLCWLAVSSFVGKKRWRQKRPDWCKKHAYLNWVRP